MKVPGKLSYPHGALRGSVYRIRRGDTTLATYGTLTEALKASEAMQQAHHVVHVVYYDHGQESTVIAENYSTGSNAHSIT